MIAQIRIDDADEYQSYLAGFMPIFERHGGELLATSRNTTKVMERGWADGRTVLMRFQSVAAAEQWYAEPDYQALARNRHRAAKANFVLVEGMG